MTVFKGYLLMIRKNRTMILLYLVIAMSVALIQQQAGGETAQEFERSRICLAVIDRDHSPFSETLYRYLEREQTLVTLEDDRAVLQENLYYRNVDYILIIPEGAGEAFENGGQEVVEAITAPGSMEAGYAASQVNSLLGQIRLYAAAGFSAEESYERALALGETKAEVVLDDQNGNAGAYRDYVYYLAYLPYTFLAASVSTIGMVMLEFRKKEIRRRMAACSVPLLQQSFAAAASFLFVGLLIWGLCIMTQTVFWKGGLFTSRNAPWYLLNTLACILTAVALAYLTGVSVSSAAAVNAVSNSISLGLCFLGGVFAPRSMLGSVEKLAQFLPTWWYTAIVEILGAAEQPGEKAMREVKLGLVIQLVFAAACFGIALMVQKARRQEKE